MQYRHPHLRKRLYDHLATLLLHDLLVQEFPLIHCLSAELEQPISLRAQSRPGVSGDHQNKKTNHYGASNFVVVENAGIQCCT
jgi:hypothetical protein